MPRMPKTHALGDAPIQGEHREMMRDVAHSLDQLFNGELRGEDRTTGFVLLVFSFGEGGRCNYISNGADRRDIVVMMKEQIARFEGQADVSGTA